MNIIIMGASGFLGSHLCSFLKVKNTVLRCGRSQKNDIILSKINNNFYLVDIISLFKEKNFVIKNVKIEVKKRLDVSRVGNIILTNIKILSLLRFILK